MPKDWNLFLELPSGIAPAAIPRSVPPQRANVGYGLPPRRPSLLSRRIRNAAPKNVRLAPLTSIRGRIVSLVLAGMLVVFLFNALSGPSTPSAAAVARQVCPPAVTLEIADDLEVSPEQLLGGMPAQTTTPPVMRGPLRSLAPIQGAKTSILTANTTAEGIVVAEGRFRAVDMRQWQFTCTVQTSGDPVVSDIVIKRTENAAPDTMAPRSR